MPLLNVFLRIDEQLFFLLNSLPHTVFLDQVFLFFSFYPLVIWSLIGLVVLFIEEKKEHWFIIRLILALSVAGLLASGVIKPLIKRPRPDISFGTQVVIVNEKPAALPWNNDFAFPSGHAAVAFAGAYTLMREETGDQHGSDHTKKGRRSLRVLFFTFATLTAVSRIYLGKHYPLDVLVGGFLGWGVGFLSWKIVDLKTAISFRTS